MTFSITMFCHYARYGVLLMIILSVIMLSFVILNVIMLSVVAPSTLNSIPPLTTVTYFAKAVSYDRKFFITSVQRCSIGATTLSITTFSIKTLSITFKKTQHST